MDDKQAQQRFDQATATYHQTRCRLEQQQDQIRAEGRRFKQHFERLADLIPTMDGHYDVAPDHHAAYQAINQGLEEAHSQMQKQLKALDDQLDQAAIIYHRARQTFDDQQNRGPHG